MTTTTDTGLFLFGVTFLFAPVVLPCLTEQRLRNGLCCWATQCEDEGFIPCQTQNGTDVCEQCPKGEYVRGSYPTSGFESSPCVEIPRCLQEEIRDESGECVCNRAEGYLRRLDNCEPTDIKCDKPGMELSEQGFCEPCNENFYKDEHNNDLCKRKRNIACSSGQIVDNGNAKSDRTCIIITTVIQRITTENSITTTNNPGSSNGLDIPGIISVTIGCILMVIIVIVSIYMTCFQNNIKGKQQSENIDITERGEMSLLNKNQSKEEESLSETIETATTHFYGGDVERDQKAKADPVDDDETFVKKPDDSNDDSLLSRAEGGAPETRFNILSAQQPQDDQTDIRLNTNRRTARVEAQVHAQQSSLPQLLTVHPVNDDSGRFLPNGEISLPIQYHNGNVATNSPMITARPNSIIVVESGNFPSDQYDPNRSL